MFGSKAANIFIMVIIQRVMVHEFGACEKETPCSSGELLISFSLPHQARYFVITLVMIIWKFLLKMLLDV